MSAPLSPLERLKALREQRAGAAASEDATVVDAAVADATVEAPSGDATDDATESAPEPTAFATFDAAATKTDAATKADAASETDAASEIAFDFSDLDAGDEFTPAATPAAAVSGDPGDVDRVAAIPASIAALEDKLSGLLDDLPAADDERDAVADDEPRYLPAGRGGVRKIPPRSETTGAAASSRLEDLLGRVDGLLETGLDPDQPFRPEAPATIAESGLRAEEIERLAVKFLANKGAASGREIAGQLRLPFTLLDELLKGWKTEQLVAYRGSAEIGDYVYQLTEPGRQRAASYAAECSFFGAAPVSLTDYLRAMEAQSIARQQASRADLTRAFSDLLIHPDLLDKLGPAINSGRGMFLYGEPGNGKTSVAERITACFGSAIWIPRTLGIDGEIIRLYDPGVHEAVDWDDHAGLFDLSGVDQRWIRVVRPTVIAGGELTMSELEVAQNPQTKICEAPLQLKSNCGTLVIDDFGRQTMPVAELLNRWIVPLEKRYDFLNLPSGKKIQVPFDQLIIFSTNLEPRDLVDGAFLRRIPYKIEVPDPLPEHFRELFRLMAPGLGLTHNAGAVEYLIAEHYERAGRDFKACHPRDLMLQVRNRAVYRGLPRVLSEEGFDFAVDNYFSVT